MMFVAECLPFAYARHNIVIAAFHVNSKPHSWKTSRQIFFLSGFK